MANSSHRSSNTMQSTVNLYCAQCESQIGIFANEWLRLTSSYARSKEKGTHFGTEIGHRTQVVPVGPAQRLAEGCAMAEVFCRKCSNMVGQYCKDSPDVEKQALVDQYFYKFSRTFLKDSRTNERVDPTFGYGSDMVKSSSQSHTVARSGTTPTSRWASTPLRQSSRTPVLPTPAIASDNTRRASSGPQMKTNEVLDDKWERSLRELRRLQEQMTLQQSSFDDQSSQILDQTSRLNEQEALLKEQQANLDEYEGYLSAQATQIVEQNEVIKGQTKRIEEQQTQLSKITNQLVKLQHTMDDLRTTLARSKQIAGVEIVTDNNKTRDDLEMTMETTQQTQDTPEELQSLRAQNQAMQARLKTIASAMGVPPDKFTFEETDTAISPASSMNIAQSLGKRKRDHATPSIVNLDNLSAPLGNTSLLPQSDSAQMPTPQSSDGGQLSPLQVPPVISKPAPQQRKNRKSITKVAQPAKRVKAANKLAEADTGEHTNDKEAPTMNDGILLHEPTADGVIIAQNNDTVNETNVSQSVGTGTVNHIKGRSARLRKSTKISTAGDEPSILEPTQTEDRRMTRAATRDTQPQDLIPSDYESLPMELDSQISTTADFLGQVTEVPAVSGGHHQLPQASLPSISMASSVLGMNLEALIASSQALGQAFGTKQTRPEISLADSTVHRQLVEHALMPASYGPSPITESIAANDLNHNDGHNNGANGYNKIQFIQDSGADYGFDISDDDDDSIFGDETLYGNDLESQIGPSNIHPPSENNRRRVTAPAAIRDDRSMAPEPPVPAKPAPAEKYSKYNMDMMHLMTPRMFVEAYAEGREPKPVRAPSMQKRIRDLHNELRTLGLQEWIPKNKKCKEYRKAVAEARARFRDHNKAAFLRSRGLVHDFPALAPAPTAAMNLVEQAENAPQTASLTAIENVPASIQPNLDEHQDEDLHVGQDVEEDIATEPRPATRAHIRRSSASLVTGLEDTENQEPGVQTKKAPVKRQPNGRRKSQRKSDIADKNQEVSIEDGPTAHDGNSVITEQPIDESMASINDEDEAALEPDAKRLKTSAKRKSKPRTSTVSRRTKKTSNTKLQGDVIEKVDSQEVSPRPSNTPVASTPFDDGANGQTKQVLDVGSQGQNREEMIMMRDRMAKELMESMDMDM